MLRNKILEGLKPCTIYCFLNFGNTILKKYKKMAVKMKQKEIALIIGMKKAIYFLSAKTIQFSYRRFLRYLDVYKPTSSPG